MRRYLTALLIAAMLGFGFGSWYYWATRPPEPVPVPGICETQAPGSDPTKCGQLN